MDRFLHQKFVFGYGSLMWNPGFRFTERIPATIHGFHRSLCMYSHMYRGTPEHPGLVLGLDRGGLCHGFAFMIASADWEETIGYLRAREQVTNMYREIVKPVRLNGNGETRVNAMLYAVDRTHRQYAGRLSLEEQLVHVRQGHGQSGSCSDYVLSTVQHLREAGIRDRRLEQIAKALALGEGPHAAIETAS
jgi:glutathione-specific gamma-glutamylcyclotransferase